MIGEGKSGIVWDPHTKCRIQQLEVVQWQAARYMVNISTDLQSSQLDSLQWPSLELCHKQAKVTMFYKMHYNLVCIVPSSYATPQLPSGLRGHNLRYTIPIPKVNCHLYSFFLRTIRLWNILPADVILAPSVDAFKQGIRGINFV